MPLPYLFTILMYVFVALLSAADASLVSTGMLPSFLALRWVRVHFITLGIVSQAVFGLLPGLAASVTKSPRPRMRWDIWLTLNAGLVALAVVLAGEHKLVTRLKDEIRILSAGHKVLLIHCEGVAPGLLLRQGECCRSDDIRVCIVHRPCKTSQTAGL